MSFRDFDLVTVQREFRVTLVLNQDLFATITPLTVSPDFSRVLKEIAPLALNSTTEKGRSEWLVAPILAQLWIHCNRQIGIFSGTNFDVDASVGLNGVCDFLICRNPNLFAITAPVAVIAEAKRDNPIEGFGQCAAGMVAAQRFNLREQNGIEEIHGVSTSGSLWRFLKLVGQTLYIDSGILPAAER